MSDYETALVHLTRARREIQTAKTFEDVRAGLSKAEQLRLLARQVDASVEIKNEVTELLLRWKRRAGEMLREGKEAGQRQSDGRPEKQLHDVTVSPPPTLAEIGVSKIESSRWQSIASIPAEEFEEVIQETKQAREELTEAALLRVAQEQKSAERREERILKVVAPLESVGRFPVIYADPPWRYDFSKDDADQVENHYPTMTVDELCELKVWETATEDAVLFMWATSPKLEDSFAVIDAWGFRYRTCRESVPQSGRERAAALGSEGVRAIERAAGVETGERFFCLPPAPPPRSRYAERWSFDSP